MQVFKFGGASVRDAAGVINLTAILQSSLRESGKTYGAGDDQPAQTGNDQQVKTGNGLYAQAEPLVVVVSAMGKTTNLLERLVLHFFNEKTGDNPFLEQARDFHFDIAAALFPDPSHPVFDEISNLFVEIEWVLEDGPVDTFDFTYDQIVSIGELLSTTIISHYLNSQGLQNTWVDARNFIATDNHYREANVDWEKTEKLIRTGIPPLFEQGFVVTQGFIGSTSENFTTTLGREGSDYSAAIFASCLDAAQVCIWKDVPGVLNADPKWFDHTELIPELSYLDAIELTYYGATVIHPKTIKPLQNKGIDLLVRSFLDTSSDGTRIGGITRTLPVPSFIFKVDQVLISIMPKDFSFIVEDNLSQIFHLFHKHRVKINMMHNSAVSFSVSVDNQADYIRELVQALETDYQVSVQEHLELITIRYYDQQTIDRVLVDKEIMMELRDRDTCQLLVRNRTTGK